MQHKEVAMLENIQVDVDYVKDFYEKREFNMDGFYSSFLDFSLVGEKSIVFKRSKPQFKKKRLTTRCHLMPFF